MTTLQLEVYEAFRSIDIPDEKAAKVAAALSTAFGKGNPEQDARVGTLSNDIASIKTDVATLKMDVTTLKTDVGVLKTDVTTLKTDMGVLKTDVVAIKLDNVGIRGELAVLKWMGGVLITMVTAILFKLFLH